MTINNRDDVLRMLDECSEHMDKAEKQGADDETIFAIEALRLAIRYLIDDKGGML